MIEVENLSKRYIIKEKGVGFKSSLENFFKPAYREIKAVKEISFKIEQGERVGFIGPNGAGKTTTLKMLSGVLYPCNGMVKVNGHTPFKREREFLSSISFLMGQKSQLWQDLTPLDNFEILKNIYGVDQQYFKEIIDQLGIALDISDKFYVPIRQLSLGQRMKCEVMASLLHNPKYIFLDEPTLGLDYQTQKNIRQFITEYNEKHNSTILMTSHYIEDIKQTCNRILIINFGKIIFDSTSTELGLLHKREKNIEVVLPENVNSEELAPYLRGINFSVHDNVLKILCKKEDVYGLLKKIDEIKIRFDSQDISIHDLPLEDFIQKIIRESNENSKNLSVSS